MIIVCSTLVGNMRVLFFVTTLAPVEKTRSDLAEEAGTAKTALAMVERMGKMSLCFFHQASTLAPLGGVVYSSYRSISFLILDFRDSLVVSVLDLIFSLSLEVGDHRALVSSGLFSTVGTNSSIMLLSSVPTFFQSSSSSLFVSSNWTDSIR